MKKLAFTLAETLIVMGIIGVVAALTLPNLNSSTGDKEKVAKLKKIYSNLNDAYGRAVAVYGPYEEWPSSKRWGRLTEFIKLSKDCNNTNVTLCFSGGDIKSYTPSKTYNMSSSSNAYAGILADGSSIGLIEGTDNNDVVLLDIDGKSKGKNITANDIFGFHLSTDGVIPFGQGVSKFEGGSFETCDCDSSYTMYLECTEWVISFDNMDYLKTKSQTCPDGKTILDGTTNITCK